MSPQPVRAVSRRATVTGATAGLLATALPAGAVLSGCDALDPSSPAASPSPDAATDPDAALVDRVRVELDELLALVSGLHRRQPALRPSLEGLLAMHTAHRDVLVEPGLPTPSPRAPRGAPDELWSLLVSRERIARKRLAGWAVDARSGTLARLLASMSAGIAAHLARPRLPDTESETAR